MAGLFNPADLTWNGKEVQDLSEIVVEKTFAKPGLSQIHRFVPGIKAKTQIGFITQIGLIGKKSAGCTTDTDTVTVTGTEKFWEPEYIEGRVVQCWKDLIPSFWSWGLKNGINKADLTSGDFFNFLKDVLSDAMYEAVLRIAWFGDKSAAEFDDSPAGTIKVGTNLNYFNPINGFWKQIFDAVTADSLRLSDGLTSRNGQATYAAQAFTSTDTTNRVVTETLAQMKYNSDFRLREQSNLVFLVTQSVFDQYAKELRSYSNVEASYTRIEGGYTSLSFEGIEVIGLNFWDRIIRAYQDNGTKYYLPHRALLTTVDNLALGSEDESNLSELEVWHEKKENSLYVDFGFNEDAKLMENYMFQVSY